MLPAHSCENDPQKCKEHSREQEHGCGLLPIQKTVWLRKVRRHTMRRPAVGCCEIIALLCARPLRHHRVPVRCVSSVWDWSGGTLTIKSHSSQSSYTLTCMWILQTIKATRISHKWPLPVFRVCDVTCGRDHWWILFVYPKSCWSHNRGYMWSNDFSLMIPFLLII